MNKLKKFLSATVLALASATVIFAQDVSNKNRVLSKVMQWEESGKLVSTGGKSSPIGNATYICDGSDALLLVESSFEVPYYYTKIWDGKEGLICIGFGTSEEASKYVLQLESELKDRYIPEFFKDEDTNLGELKAILRDFTELERVTLGGKDFDVYYVDLDSDFENELDSESFSQESGGATVLPPSDLYEKLDAILGRIVELEESKVLQSSDCVGTDENGYTYISDGKNRYLITDGWELPVCYMKIYSEEEGVPNVLDVLYGYDNEVDKLTFALESLNLRGIAYKDFFKGINIKGVLENKSDPYSTVEIDGETFKVYFEYVKSNTDEWTEEDYSGNMENRRGQKPSDQELESLFQYIMSLENSGSLVDTQIRGVNASQGYAYISDGKNVYLVDDEYDIPFEYNRIISTSEDVPNILFVAYGHNDSWDRYYFSKERQSLAIYEGRPDFFSVDSNQIYCHILGYTISYRNKVVIDGVEYEVYFSDINDDQETGDELELEEEDVDFDVQLTEIPALDKDGLESLLDSIVKEMNSKSYPSLLKTDKPYAILSDAGRYIMMTDGYATHVDVTGDYFFTAQLYTADYETGLMVVGFTRNNEDDLYALSLFGQQQVDEVSIEEAHRKGEFFVTDYDLAEFQKSVDEAGYVLEKDVYVNGIKYHAYCIPINSSDWNE